MLVLLQLLWRIRFDLALLLCRTVLVHNNWIPGGCTANESVVGIMGIAASIFLGFRNTQAIERWWEGRKLWGTDTNVSRNWADSLHAHLDSFRINYFRTSNCPTPQPSASSNNSEVSGSEICIARV